MNKFILAVCLAPAAVASAADGIWTDVTVGPNNWSNTALWATGAVADGTGATASFTSDIAVGSTVTLDSSRTIGNLVFSDAGGTGSAWTLAGTNALTLSSGGVPTITTTTSAIISVPLVGASGLTKTGAQPLTLAGVNSFTGGILVSQGRLNASIAALGSNVITAGVGSNYGTAYASGGTPFLNITDTTSVTLANDLVLPSPGSAAYYAIQKVTAGSALLLKGNISGGSASSVFQLDTPNGGDSSTSFTLSGNNTFNGTLRLNRGNLTLTNSSAAGNATIFLQSNANASGNLRFANSFTLPNNITFGTTAANDIATQGYDVTLSGVLSGAAANWTKRTGGTLTIANASNTYAGTTNVAAGTLRVTGNYPSALVINSGGALSGTGTVGAVTLNAGANLHLTGGVTTNSLGATAVTIAGLTNVVFGSPLVNGNVYDVISYTGTSPGLANLNTTVYRPGSFADTGTKITLTAAVGTRTWNAGTETWGINTAANNFTEDDQKFFSGDHVLFGDTIADAAVTLSGRLTPSSVVVINSANTYTFSGVAGSADITGGAYLLKSGAGTLRITSLQSYDGGTIVDGGTLQLGNSAATDYGASGLIRGAVTVNSGGTLLLQGSNALGYGFGTKVNSITLNGGTVTHAGNGDNGWGVAYTLVGGTLQTTGAGQFAFGGPSQGTNTTVTTLAAAGTSIIAGKVVLRGQGGNSTVNFTVADGSAVNDLTVSANLSEAGGTAGITKLGPGTMLLTGTNTYAGATVVSEGTLVVNGSISGATTVNGTGVLSGTGTIGALSINSGGTAAPGGSPGILNTGNLSFNGGTFAVELNGSLAGSEYDQLNVAGTATLTATTPLTISLGYDPVDFADSFTILNNDGSDAVSTNGGAFLFSFAGDSLSEGEAFTVGAQLFSITYAGGSGNDVVLSAIPEPASACFLLGGFGAILSMRRFRRV